MNTDSKHTDDFYQLMQTQQLHEVPDFLEKNIMQKIESSVVIKSSPIKIQAIFIFSLLSCLYILCSFISAYYYPNLQSLSDFKNLVLVGMFVQVVYELNEIIPTIFTNHTSFKKELNY